MILNHRACIGLLIIAYLVVFPLYYMADSKIITAGNDMINIIPGSFAMEDSDLFSSDLFFSRFLEFYPGVFLHLHNFVTQLTGDFITTNYLISSILFLVFLIGVYFLVFYLFKDSRIALISALLSIAVRPALGVKYGIKIGQAIPRYLILALSPWLIWYALHWLSTKKKEKCYWKWALLFVIIGAFALVHPISAGLLALILLGYVTLGDYATKQKAKYWFVGLCSFVVGAFPFIVDKLNFVGTGGIAPRALILSRAWFILPPYPRNFGNYGLFFLQIAPFVLVGAIGYMLAKKKEKEFAKMAISVAAVTCLTALEYFWPKAVTFEFLRASVWIYVPLLAYAAVAIVRLYEKDTLKKICAVLIFVILAIPAVAITPATGYAISLYGSLTGQTPFVFDYGGVDQFHAGIIDVGQFMQTTPKDSLFLVPQRGFAHLRLYGKRSLVVTHKDANIHSYAGAIEWKERYDDVASVYSQQETSVFVDAAEKYGTDYIVIDKLKHTLDLEIAYENDRFVVYFS